MVQTRTLLEVSEVTDSEVAHANIGDIDFRIYTGLVENHIKRFGQKGKSDIMNTLAYLIGEVAKIQVPADPANCPSQVAPSN